MICMIIVKHGCLIFYQLKMTDFFSFCQVRLRYSINNVVVPMGNSGLAHNSVSSYTRILPTF